MLLELGLTYHSCSYLEFLSWAVISLPMEVLVVDPILDTGFEAHISPLEDFFIFLFKYRRSYSVNNI